MARPDFRRRAGARLPPRDSRPGAGAVRPCRGGVLSTVTSRTPTRSAVDGALALAAAMGIGRFAYTALLPETQRALGAGDDVAGAIASVNLAGDLAGVLAARHLAASPARAAALQVGLAATARATLLGAATAAPLAWVVVRAAAGVASGLVFVLASGAALERAAPPGKLYGGVGFGIALSGAVAALTPRSASWEVPWLVLGIAAAALEAMSRFAVDPRWLIYLPLTMSPSETTREPGLLEHPREALDYFAKEGVARAVCEEKHMGSRAVVVVCRDAAVARRRFGVETGDAAICYTRTGRRFFNDAALEQIFLDRVRTALDASGFWDEHATDWACIDAELMPWSLKAQELLRDQYAAVGAASRAALPAAITALESATAR